MIRESSDTVFPVPEGISNMQWPWAVNNHKSISTDTSNWQHNPANNNDNNGKQKSSYCFSMCFVYDFNIK